MWSVAAKHKDDGAQSDPTVNYNTYALGREGYITLDLITQQSQVPKDKGAVLALLNNIDYVEGKRYADFNSSTDKVAEYAWPRWWPAWRRSWVCSRSSAPSC